MAHPSDSQRLTAGLHPPPSLTHPFAAVQAAWRFCASPRVRLPQLAGALIECVRADASQVCADWMLVVMDWSHLHFGGHDSKVDRVELAHSKDLRYDLLSALAVGDHDGSPMAPLCLELRAQDGTYSTRADQPIQSSSPLHGLEPVMAPIEELKLGPTSVFIIDREADSIGHDRTWDALGRRFIVRADNNRLVLQDGQERRLNEVAESPKSGTEFALARSVLFQGRPAQHLVPQTAIVLHRPARTE